MPTARPWHRTAVAAGLLLALATGGCSTSYKLGSLLGQDKNEQAGLATGSLASDATAAADGLPPASDLAFAKAAASEALTRQGKDVSVPWENPRTGSRGAVTPLAGPRTQNGFVCHDFLASYVHGEKQAWLQGEACRVHRGQWEVRSIKPWKRS